MTSSQYCSNRLASSTHSSEHWCCKNFPASAPLMPCLCRLCRSLPEPPLYPIFGGKQAHSSSRIWCAPWFHRLIIPSGTPPNCANNTHDSNQVRWDSSWFYKLNWFCFSAATSRKMAFNQFLIIDIASIMLGGLKPEVKYQQSFAILQCWWPAPLH